MNREQLKGHLDLLLMSVLAAGPTHGYAIITALRERSQGTFDLHEGTIYPALYRLEDAGLAITYGWRMWRMLRNQERGDWGELA
jgi:PadR family transcriptional regulator, regulatory protein PadR